MASSRFASMIARCAGIRRLPVSPGVGKCHPSPSDHNLGSVARAVAGILAVGGGLWLIPPPAADSPISAAADSVSRFLQDNRPKFLLPESYRRRVFFKYEKRLRLQSQPEKIFEYFASFNDPEGELFMSASDLMRAVVPVFPPSESHIIREGHLRGERLPGELHCDPSPLFVLFDTNSDGLISFPEYIFFVTLLSIPESNFRAAFKNFDLDNSGEIEMEEFKKVMALMRSYNRQGACHCNGLRLGLRVSRSVDNAGLVEYFFGKDRKQKLQHDKFVKFLRDLHDEIVRLEFDHYDFKSRKTISSKDFALSMAASADLNHIDKFLDRADKVERELHLREIRITFEEFKAFADLRKKLQPLTVAIFSFGKINGQLTKDDFRRAACHVCEIPLSDNVIDIIFHVFDLNGDGSLSAEEFLRVLQKRDADIRQPTMPGLAGFSACSLGCSGSPAHLAS